MLNKSISPETTSEGSTVLDMDVKPTMSTNRSLFVLRWINLQLMRNLLGEHVKQEIFGSVLFGLSL